MLSSMSNENEDAFSLASTWGFMLAQSLYDEAGNDGYPSWVPDVFLAMTSEVENLPSDCRDKVVAAAVEAWRKSGK